MDAGPGTDVWGMAERIGREVRIESQKNRREKWQKRASRMLETFVRACGGEVAAGVVLLADKPVRVDYLKKSLRQLAVDKPVGLSVFYKSLPVNVEAWIRAMCTFDIATHVPRWWALRRSRHKSAARDSLVARLGVRNEVPEAETVLAQFATNAKHRGLRVQRVSEETVNRVLHKDERTAPVVRLASPRDVLGVSGMSAETSEVLVRIRPTQTLEYEEVIGLLERGGRVVCVGNQTRVVLTFFIEPGGAVFKTCRNTSPPHYLRECADACVSWLSWSLEVHTPAFVFGDPLSGADTRVTILRGVRLEVLMFIHDACDPGERHHRLDEMAKAFLREIRAEERAACARATSPKNAVMTHANCDLVKTLCELVKRNARDRMSEKPSAESAPMTWEGAPFARDDETPPRKCRNGWILLDGTVVEKADIVAHRVRFRTRWPTNFKKCSACPTLHPDPRRREREKCGSIGCKSRFWVSDTLTHYCFRGHKLRREELDKNAPLFTDEVLRELERSSGAFHIMNRDPGVD